MPTQTNSIDKGLLENLRLGLIEEVSPGKFSITKKGESYVEAMPFNSDEQRVNWLNSWED